MNVLDAIKQQISALVQLPGAVSQAQQAQEQSKPFAQASPYWKNANAIRAYLKDYGSPHADEIASGTLDMIEKYPIYQEMPYMIPAVAVNETSAGQNMKGNRLVNWGIYEPTYNPTSIPHEIERMGSGVAERMPAYTEFRKTKDMNDFAKVYAPVSDNNSPNYGKNVLNVMDEIKRYEK